MRKANIVRRQHIIIGTQTDSEIAKEVGRRLRAYRLQRNIGTVDIAARAGLNRNTIVHAEAGANPRLDTIIKILRVLGRLDAFDAFLPPPTLSPLEVMRSAKKPRQRARRTSRG